MLGHSMGGGITQSVLVVQPDLVKAAVLYAPVSMNARDSYERWTKKKSETVKKIVEAHGSPETNPEFWDNVSAVNFVERITAPIKIYHGDRAPDVPPEWTQKIVKLLRAEDKTIELIVLPGQPHEFTVPTWNRFMEGVTEFFKASL